VPALPARLAPLIALAACDPTPTGLCAPDAPPELALGHGSGRNFTEFADGESLAFEFGPQGGQHLPVSVWAAHLDHPERVGVRVQGYVGAASAFDYTALFDFACVSPDEGQLSADLTFALNDADQVANQDVLLRLEVVDTDQPVTTEVTVRVVPPG
jgi:hypothetical protein